MTRQWSQAEFGGGFRVDAANQCLWRDGIPINLAPKPFALLRYFLANPGRLLPQAEILDAVWPGACVQPEVLKTCVRTLRVALGDPRNPSTMIETRPKRGYRFVAPVSEDEPARYRDDAFIGRREELSTVRRAMTDAACGERRVLLITGASGIGKTALVERIGLELAGSGELVVACRAGTACIAEPEPGAALRDMVEGLGRQLDADQFGTLLARIAPSFLGGPGTRPLTREFCGLIEAAGAGRTLVLVLDDLHWADTLTLEAVSLLAHRRHEARLLMIVTICNGPSGLRRPVRALRLELLLHRLSLELPLAAFSRQETTLLLGDERTASLVFELSEGNPLFASLIVADLAQRGLVARTGAHWRLVATLPPELGVPAVLRDLVDHELGEMKEQDCRLLEAASLAGRDFCAWAVAILLDRPTLEIEQHLCDFASRSPMIEPLDLRPMPDGTLSRRFRFSHGLYLRVLNQRVSPAMRAERNQHLGGFSEAMWQGHVTRGIAEGLALRFEWACDDRRARHYRQIASGAVPAKPPAAATVRGRSHV